MAAPTTQTSAGPLAGLNAQQRRAAEAVTGPLCILAGAGSGKTRTVTHRIAHQVASGVARPDQILAVTFTERAARELRARLAALGIGAPIRAATFHAAAWAQLRHFWSRVEDGPLPEVLASKVRLLVPAARRLHVEAADLAAEIEWAKARRVEPAAYPAAAARRDAPVDATTMAEVYAAYEAEKARRNTIDYEDMLLRTSRLLDDHEDVAGAVRDRYRFFTVDEFQDVNPAQWFLLRAWLGGRDELCVVGDDDQTIYSFTGASSTYLTGFASHFPGATVVTLTENYRSTPQILALANRVLWTKPAGSRKRLTSRAAAGPEPVLREFDDAEGEREAVVTRIRSLIREGVPPGEIAICYRVNNQSQWYEEALADADIPFAVRGEHGFFDRPEIRQAVAALRDAAESTGRSRPADPPPPAGAAAAGPPRADREVEAVLRERLSWHPRRQPSGQAAKERWRNLAQLVEVAALAVQTRPGTTLGELVADFSARAAAGQEAPGPDGAVTLLTLHRAKGCEFDAVFLVACEEGLLPITYARTDAEVEEERRLLYVGVTRARHHLWVSWARSRPGYSGKPVSRRPSRFLYHLGRGAPARARQPSRRATAGAAATAAEPADAAVVERLRAWRKERADRDGVPAFVVFNDRTMTELAASSPSSLAELLGVHGFGPAKVRRYGEELLRVIGDTRGGGQTPTH